MTRALPRGLHAQFASNSVKTVPNGQWDFSRARFSTSPLMTQPVSSRTRWPGQELTCSDPSAEDDESSTCDETESLQCAAERTHPPIVPYARSIADSPSSQARSRDSPWGLAFCRDADTVVAGFLCNEPTVVSDACRKPTNAFDEFVCDEPRMKELQWRILRETWALLKSLATSRARKP